MEVAEARAALREHPMDEKVIARRREMESLQLSRDRVIRDIEAAQNPKYKEMLRQSLAFLDEKLAKTAAS